MPVLTGALAYQQAARHRGTREQEADVFRRVNAALHSAGDDRMAQARAMADNGRLWLAVMDAMRDPANGLPAPLRASVVSVGLAVQREAAAPHPDLGFITGINEQIAAGLSGG